MRPDDNSRKIMIERALAARDRAWAPYSNYHVGACVLTEAGSMHDGVNVENSSYGGTICAERSAICSAVTAEGPKMRIVALAVATASSPPASPCGLCRQVIAEFANDEIPIYLVSSSGEMEEVRFGDLLPRAFRSTSLPR